MEKVIIACLSCESATTSEKSRSLVLALSRSRASRFFKTSIFQTRLWFSCENLAFLFLNKKARLEIASGPNGTPYLHDKAFKN